MSEEGTPDPKAAPPATPAPVYSDVPGEFKDNEAIKGFVDDTGKLNVAKMAQGFVDTKKMVGAGRFSVPEAPDDAEGWGKVYDAIGRPKSAEDYRIEAGEDVPDEVKFGQEDLTFYKEMAHGLGLNQYQLSQAMSKIEERESTKWKAFSEGNDKKRDQAVGELRAEWGEAYDRNVEIAQKAVSAFGGEEAKAFFNESGLGNHPAMIKMMVAAGKNIGEDRLLSTGTKNLNTRTPEEAKAELGALRLDEKFNQALMTSDHPGHAEAVARQQVLIQQSNPTKDPLKL